MKKLKEFYVNKVEEKADVFLGVMTKAAKKGFVVVSMLDIPTQRLIHLMNKERKGSASLEVVETKAGDRVKITFAENPTSFLGEAVLATKPDQVKAKMLHPIKLKAKSVADAFKKQLTDNKIRLVKGSLTAKHAKEIRAEVERINGLTLAETRKPETLKSLLGVIGFSTKTGDITAVNDVLRQLGSKHYAVLEKDLIKLTTPSKQVIAALKDHPTRLSLGCIATLRATNMKLAEQLEALVLAAYKNKPEHAFIKNHLDDPEANPNKYALEQVLNVLYTKDATRYTPGVRKLF